MTGFARCYLQDPGPREALVAALARLVGGAPSGRHVDGGTLELTVDRNDEAGPAEGSAAFLSYAWTIEIEGASATFEAALAALVTALRARGAPFVIAWDHEDRLPGGGRYPP